MEFFNHLSIPDFRVKVTQGISLTSILLLLPFLIYHLMAGNAAMVLGSAVIIAVFALVFRSCRQPKYDERYALYFLVPAILMHLWYSFEALGVLATYWSYPAVFSFYFMLSERRAQMASTIFTLILIAQSWQVFDPAVALRFSVSLVMVCAFSAICIRVICQQQDKMMKLALIDPLTGLNNRVILNDTLQHAVQQSQRTGSSCTLIVLDLDHFKSINDSMGHNVGDAVLRKVGNYLKQRVRASDWAFRIGGEEFMVVLHNTNIEEAHIYAEELRRGLASCFADAEYSVTASIGVAELLSDEDWEAWVNRSDNQLYCAKANGRDQVAVAYA